jgi:hypothetical protein
MKRLKRTEALLENRNETIVVTDISNLENVVILFVYPFILRSCINCQVNVVPNEEA